MVERLMMHRMTGSGNESDKVRISYLSLLFVSYVLDISRVAESYDLLLGLVSVLLLRRFIPRVPEMQWSLHEFLVF